MAILEWDAIVDANRQGDFETIQAADDALDGGAYMVYVKSGVYAGFTVSTNNVWIFCEPGTVITGAVMLSGAGVCLQMGSGSDIQGLVTLGGTGNSLVCENGVDIDGVLATGSKCYVTGGGWGTVSAGDADNQGCRVQGAESIVENISVQTPAGGGGPRDGLDLAGARCIGSNVRVVNSDDLGCIANAADCLFIGCLVENSDSEGMRLGQARTRSIGNHFASGVTGIGMRSLANGDNSVIVGNISDPGGSAITLDAGGDNVVVVGNRTDGAITDNSAGAVVALNDETAF